MRSIRRTTPVATALLAMGLPAVAAAQGPSLNINAYAELIYQRFDYGPNQNLPNGSEPDSRAEVDLRRFNLSFTSKIDETLTFDVEIEFEQLSIRPFANQIDHGRTSKSVPRNT